MLRKGILREERLHVPAAPPINIVLVPEPPDARRTRPIPKDGLLTTQRTVKYYGTIRCFSGTQRVSSVGGPMLTIFARCGP